MNETTKRDDESFKYSNMTQKEMIEHFEYYKNPKNRITLLADKWERRVYFSGSLAFLSFLTLFMTCLIGSFQDYPDKTNQVFMDFFSFSMVGIVFFSIVAYICNEMKNKHNKVFNYFERSQYDGNILDLFSGPDAELFFEMQKEEIIERIEARNQITGELLLWLYDSIHNSYTIDTLRQQKKAQETIAQLNRTL